MQLQQRLTTLAHALSAARAGACAGDSEPTSEGDGESLTSEGEAATTETTAGIMVALMMARVCSRSPESFRCRRVEQSSLPPLGCLDEAVGETTAVDGT